jgi:DNA modification methylase
VSIVFADDWLTVHHGDWLDVLREMPDESVNCVVTSPPYWGLRDYGIPPIPWGGDPSHAHEWGEPVIDNATNHTDKRRWQHTRNGRDEEQPPEKRVAWRRTDVVQGAYCACGAWCGSLGLEPTPDEFVAHLVEGFREVRRVLRRDGTCWLNLGDSYASHDPGDRRDGTFLGPTGEKNDTGHRSGAPVRNRTGIYRTGTLKPKDRVMIPARVALALQADGWWLRDEIVWAKPNPMPSSVRDRTTPAHEMVYLLTRSARYWFDSAAIRERAGDKPSGNVERKIATEGERSRLNTHMGSSVPWPPARVKVPGGWDISKGAGGHGSIHREGRTEATYADGGADGQRRMRDRTLAARADGAPHDDPFGNGRNKRSVWTVATAPYPEAHFATFPPKLIEPMILAGCPGGGVVLDPFAGSGTTGMVAQSLSRRAVLIDLNADYLLQALDRNRAIPLGIEVPA